MQLDAELSHPRGRVWRALTDRKMLNAWFQPVDSGWRVTPNYDLPSFDPFELELVPTEQAARLLWRWHGKDFFSEAEWELTPTEGGCRLGLRQSGFLGSHETSRRKELLAAYQKMFDRLRGVLDSLAAGGGALGSLAPRPQPPPDLRRVALISVACAAVIVVMGASALAFWATNPDSGPGGAQAAEADLGAGTQLGVPSPTVPAPTGSPSVLLPAGSEQPTPTRSPSPPPSPSLSPSPVPGPATATYRVIGLPEGGFDAEVTVRRGGQGGWTVVLTMPRNDTAVNRSPAVVSISQRNKAVTVVPVSADGVVTFVIRYTGAKEDKSLQGCTVDGQPCRAT